MDTLSQIFNEKSVNNIVDPDMGILFKANDIGNFLQISNIRNLIKDFDNTQKIQRNITTEGGSQSVSFLTKKGLCNLLMKLNHKIANNFRDEIYEKYLKNEKNYTVDKPSDDLTKLFRSKYTFCPQTIDIFGGLSTKYGGFGSKVKTVIPNNSKNDYIDEIILCITLKHLPSNSSYAYCKLDYSILEFVKLNIGGQEIFTYHGDFLSIEEDLHGKKESCLFCDENFELILPLKFFRIPIFDLQHQVVDLEIQFKKIEDCIQVTDYLTPKSDSLSLQLQKILNQTNFLSAKLIINGTIEENKELLINFIPYSYFQFVFEEKLLLPVSNSSSENNYSFCLDLHLNFKTHYIVIISTFEIEKMSLYLDAFEITSGSGEFYNKFVPKYYFNGKLPKNTYVIPFITSKENTFYNLSSINKTILKVQFKKLSNNEVKEGSVRYGNMSTNYFRTLCGMGAKALNC